ncbi:MAG: CocE/NonD family hydrolase [Actinomycetota bacterium]|nr:CocE/NonD family hydrolase [Actinomycetota bacterium]
MNWRDKVSQPQYAMRATKRLRAPMRDGVELSVDIFGPDTDEPFPALISYSPYWNEGQYLPVPSANPHPTAAWGNYAIEAGDSEYFAARGYVHVVANVRGTGESDGEYQLMGPVEAQDGYDLVEWVAAQSWCDGNVGMVGVSYFSWIQYLVAAQQPPHLKAIAPLEGATDFYRDVCYRGGILSLGFLSYWNSELSDRDSTSRSEREMSAEALRERIEQVKAENEDIRHLYSVYQLLCAPKKCPVLFDALMHPTDSEWYHERSGYTGFDKITVPVFCGAALDFWDLHLAGGFRAWRDLPDLPKKLLIYPRFHLRPFAENHDLLVRWFDHWLKGNDTGLLDEPDISLWVQGEDAWREEDAWPLDRTKWTRMYLRPEGLLSGTPPEGSEGTDSFDNVPYVTLESTFGGVPHLAYRTEPLAEPLEITGPIALELYASLTDTDGHWIVELRDVAPDGESRIVSKGWLKASFRARDEARSAPFRPDHPYDVAVPVVPGEIEQYSIQIHDTSNVFLAGHCMELIIKSLDHSLEGGWNTIFYHLPSSHEVTHTVHHDHDYPSHLLLPVIPPST